MNVFSNLSNENEKLKKHNELLSSELAQARKQCDELVAFLTERVKVSPDQFNRIMRQGSYDSTRDDDDHGRRYGAGDPDDDENGSQDCNGSLKLFGVWLKGAGKKRFPKEKKIVYGEPYAKQMKTVDFNHAGMRMKSGKVCN
ncbi:hypothetical protein Goari_027211 [Gossypium aridum]|uniref:Uncharacterized protein n=1 Tax=Gossypium aridum TaxID=34290 RepID=A0A7J8YMG1_GOSAI|nr:hypothetical protein [Gossypium aridum]